MPPKASGSTRVAYIVSRFPKLTETFVLNELLALESMGAEIELYPLLRERQAVAHPEARRWTQRAHFQPFLSIGIVAAQWRFFQEDPLKYLRLWSEVLRGTWGSLNFLVGALGIFPKVVWFARDMQRRGVTHVHAHFANHPALAAFIIHRLTGISYSFTAHGSDLHVDRRMLGTKVMNSAFAVTISEYNRELIVEECGERARAKVRVIHCGIDPAVFAPGGRALDGHRPLRIICVASFGEVKGHRYLIDACRLLDRRGIDFECHLVGEGELRGSVENRIGSCGLTGKFHLHGSRTRPEVADLLACSDVAVLASHPTASGKREGIPVALMEAMGCGLPVVSSDLSGIPELVESGRTGILVAPGDVEALADALERLARSPDERLEMGRLGREKVLRDFDLFRNAASLLELIEQEPENTVDPRSPHLHEVRPEFQSGSRG